MNLPAAYRSPATQVRVRRHYSKPPIQEVVVELRIPQLQPQVVQQLKAFRDASANLFSTEEAVVSGEVEVHFDGTGAQLPEVKRSSQVFGYTYKTPDLAQLAQVRLNGMSYHKLPPYSRWEDVLDQARKLWNHYYAITRAPLITQIGLRYINRFNLPAPCDIESFLKTFPNISADLPQLISGYVMQLSMPQVDMANTVLVHRQALTSPQQPHQASIVVDNDLVTKQEFQSESEQPWEFLEVMHHRQNEIFEGSITDATRDLLR